MTGDLKTINKGAPLDGELLSAGGGGLSITEFGSSPEVPESGPGVVRLGIHRGGSGPDESLDGFDILLSADPAARRPWVYVPRSQLDATASNLFERVKSQPSASAAAVQVLRMTLSLPFSQALQLESLAYSMLLASSGFRAWRHAHPRRERALDTSPRVRFEYRENILSIRLDRPARRNAFDAALRDELAEILTFGQLHPETPKIVLSGSGPAFSAGGDLDEFGQADDVARAHLIRTLRSPTALVEAMRDRVTARLHGACIGAGIETTAAAGRVVASAGSWFNLPEVGMGLIPGAGGTASIARRIGRRRCAFMAISGAAIDLSTALAWGLVDLEDEPG